MTIDMISRSIDHWQRFFLICDKIMALEKAKFNMEKVFHLLWLNLRWVGSLKNKSLTTEWWCGHYSKLILIANNRLIHTACILVGLNWIWKKCSVLKKYKIISKIMSFAKIYPGTEKVNFYGNDFLPRIHSSMFFLFPLQNHTLEIHRELLGTHSRIWEWKLIL